MRCGCRRGTPARRRPHSRTAPRSAPRRPAGSSGACRTADPRSPEPRPRRRRGCSPPPTGPSSGRPGRLRPARRTSSGWAPRSGCRADRSTRRAPARSRRPSPRPYRARSRDCACSYGFLPIAPLVAAQLTRYVGASIGIVSPESTRFTRACPNRVMRGGTVGKLLVSRPGRAPSPVRCRAGRRRAGRSRRRGSPTSPSSPAGCCPRSPPPAGRARPGCWCRRTR